jgi:hypothetical protein
MNKLEFRKSFIVYDITLYMDNTNSLKIWEGTRMLLSWQEPEKDKQRSTKHYTEN